jgi:hypothetical protein
VDSLDMDVDRCAGTCELPVAPSAALSVRATAVGDVLHCSGTAGGTAERRELEWYAGMSVSSTAFTNGDDRRRPTDRVRATGSATTVVQHDGTAMRWCNTHVVVCSDNRGKRRGAKGWATPHNGGIRQ